MQRVWGELRGNQNGFVSWCSIYFNNVWVVRLMNETIFKRKIWVASGFHCADTATKLVFPSKLLFYMPNHQEFPTFCTRFLRTCSCWIHRWSRRMCHRTRTAMAELRWSTLLVWHLEGAALGTGNLDHQTVVAGGWWWLVLWNDSIWSDIIWLDD